MHYWRKVDMKKLSNIWRSMRKSRAILTKKTIFRLDAKTFTTTRACYILIFNRMIQPSIISEKNFQKVKMS